MINTAGQTESGKNYDLFILYLKIPLKSSATITDFKNLNKMQLLRKITEKWLQSLSIYDCLWLY